MKNSKIQFKYQTKAFPPEDSIYGPLKHRHRPVLTFLAQFLTPF